MKTLVLPSNLLLPLAGFALTYSVDWSAISGGGGTSTDNVYSITGTVGQPLAGQQVMTNGVYSVAGGFWNLTFVSLVQTPGAPILSISCLGNSLVISWPNSSGGWVLQSTTNLAAPVWVTEGTSGNPFIIPRSLAVPHEYFRLAQVAPAARLTPIVLASNPSVTLIPVAVSSNGQVVIANDSSSGMAYRWHNGTMESISDYNADGVSGDGNSVVGTDNTGRGWLAAGGTTGVLPNLGNANWFAYCYGISADGLTAVGGAQYGNSGGVSQAVKWTNGIVAALPFLPYGNDGEACAASTDGSVIVGWSVGQFGDYPARWDGNGVSALSSLPNAPFNGRALAVSASGQYAAGWAQTTNHGLDEAVLWNSFSAQELGYLPGGTNSQAFGVSADGKAVVGQSAVDSFSVHNEAFLWTPPTGMESLAQALAAAAINTNGWSFQTAQAITPDGRYIVGSGTFNGAGMGFLVDFGMPQ